MITNELWLLVTTHFWKISIPGGVCGAVELPVLLVLQQLAVPTGQGVASLTEKLQWLLLVDGTENGPLSWRSNRL